MHKAEFCRHPSGAPPAADNLGKSCFECNGMEELNHQTGGPGSRTLNRWAQAIAQPVSSRADDSPVP